MPGHSEFLQWAREEHFKNKEEREAFHDPILDFDDYILLNIDYLIEKYIKYKDSIYV